MASRVQGLRESWVQQQDGSRSQGSDDDDDDTGGLHGRDARVDAEGAPDRRFHRRGGRPTEGEESSFEAMWNKAVNFCNLPFLQLQIRDRTAAKVAIVAATAFVAREVYRALPTQVLVGVVVVGAAFKFGPQIWEQITKNNQ